MKDQERAHCVTLACVTLASSKNISSKYSSKYSIAKIELAVMNSNEQSLCELVNFS